MPALAAGGHSANFGWVAPGSSAYWLYAVVTGIVGALGALVLLRSRGLSVGSASSSKLLYMEAGYQLDNCSLRGHHFPALCFQSHSQVRHSLECHVIFVMGLAYALFRWKSNSTAAAALMHFVFLQRRHCQHHDLFCAAFLSGSFFPDSMPRPSEYALA